MVKSLRVNRRTGKFSCKPFKSDKTKLFYHINENPNFLSIYQNCKWIKNAWPEKNINITFISHEIFYANHRGLVIGAPSSLNKHFRHFTNDQKIYIANFLSKYNFPSENFPNELKSLMLLT